VTAKYTAGDKAHVGQDVHPEPRHRHAEGNTLYVIHGRMAGAVGDLVGTVGQGVPHGYDYVIYTDIK
jgi:hypothetical protein